MGHTKRCGALVVCSLLSGLLAWPAPSRAQVNAEFTGWLFHRDAPACASCAAPTTYAPPYNANRIVWMPSYGVTTTCNPYVPQSCSYVTYLPTSGCCPTGGCGAPGGCSACGGCCGACGTTVAYTTYRPFLSWLFRPFQPYTTYRMAYYAPSEPACCAAPACAGCPTCATSACFAPACPTCSSCSSCASAGCSACDGCASSVYEGGSYAPSCASCAAAAATLPAVSQPSATPGPYLNDANPSPGNPPESTYKSSLAPSSESKTGITSPTITAPASGTMNEPRSMPPGHTAARPIRQATYLLPVAIPVQSKRPLTESDDSDEGWHDARD